MQKQKCIQTKKNITKVLGRNIDEIIVLKQIVQNIDLQLCFLEIDGDGLVYRKMIKRKVPKSDSPLTNAIKLLLKGPDPLQSTEKNCMSVIPKGTNLLSAKVQDGVAYLNFNDALEFNQDGVVGRNYSLD